MIVISALMQPFGLPPIPELIAVTSIRSVPRYVRVFTSDLVTTVIAARGRSIPLMSPRVVATVLAQILATLDQIIVVTSQPTRVLITIAVTALGIPGIRLAARFARAPIRPIAPVTIVGSVATITAVSVTINDPPVALSRNAFGASAIGG